MSLSRKSYGGSDKSPRDAGSVDSLYADHEISDEMVIGPIGPVEIWKPVVTFKFASKTQHSEPEKKKKEEAKQQDSRKICETEDSKHYRCDLKFFANSGMKAHLQKHTKPKHICEKCKKEFKLYYYLEKHMITHSNERPFSCDICNKRFKRDTTLISHQQTHEKIKPYKCKHCPKSFTHKGQLQTHTRLHTGEKPYKCNMCCKEFTQQTTLNNHLLLHQGIKPHRCEFCYEQFRQVSNLKQHLAINHSDGNVEATKHSHKKLETAKTKNAMKEKNDKTDQKCDIEEILKFSLIWYRCKKCEIVFSCNDSLSKHKKLFHDDL